MPPINYDRTLSVDRYGVRTANRKIITMKAFRPALLGLPWAQIQACIMALW